MISYDAEPFLPTIFSHNNTPSAYPPDRTYGFSPLNIYYSWADEAFDETFHNAARQSAEQLRKVAIAEGQNLTGSAMYPNYAIYDTPLEDMYGDNVAVLKALKATVDPKNVMGMAGGFKF